MLARVKILQPTREADDAATWIEQHVFIPKSAIADISNPVVWIVSDINKGIGKHNLQHLYLVNKYSMAGLKFYPVFQLAIELLQAISTLNKVM